MSVSVVAAVTAFATLVNTTREPFVRLKTHNAFVDATHTRAAFGDEVSVPTALVFPANPKVCFPVAVSHMTMLVSLAAVNHRPSLLSATAFVPGADHC